MCVYAGLFHWLTALLNCCELMPSVFSANNNEKTPRETQTLRAGCRRRSQKIFSPPQTSRSGAQDGQNLISWRWSLPSPTDPVWWRSMHAISSYRGNRPTNKQTTNKHTNKHTNRQDRLRYTAPLSLRAV